MNRVHSPFPSITWACAAIFGLLCPIGLRADDWPQWRGPNRDGVYSETGLLESFPADGLKVRWRVPVGWGFSSPVVANGRVIVSDAQLARPKVREQVLCFDEATGKPLWNYSREAIYPDWEFVAGQEQGPNATPVVEDGKVYALGPLGHRLFCLEAVSGALLWEKDLAAEYQIDPTTGISASPLIEGKLLILLIGGKPDAGVVALDRDTGNEVWRSLNESAAHSSPIVITAGGSRQLIVWTLQSVTAMDPATGKLYWREKFNAGGSASVVSTPVFSDNRLLVNGLMLQLDAEKPNASVLWPARPPQRFLTSTSTALLRGDYLFCCEKSGQLVCREASTGKEVWQADKVTDSNYGTTTSIHLTANGDSVLLFNDRGELIRARLTAEGYDEISRVRLIEPTYPSSGRKVAWSSPAFANRHVFARSDKELICASLAANPDR
jgi:outer membrane protein assembly factor BamB